MVSLIVRRALARQRLWLQPVKQVRSTAQPIKPFTTSLDLPAIPHPALKTLRTRIVFVIGLAVMAPDIGCERSPARRQDLSLQCGNYMASIGTAARLWAHDHDGRFPPDLLSLSNEGAIPAMFICPGDRTRKPAASWAVFTPDSTSYEMVTPGLRDGETNGVFFRCKIHGHLGYGDGTVFDGVSKRTKIY